MIVLVRLAWVAAYGSAVRMLPRRDGGLLPTVRGGFVVGWCGMRGIVTLAAAIALPPGFPHRDLIVFTAFAVVLGTLVLQGLTLGPLLAWFAMPADDSVARELALARAACARAVLDALSQEPDSEARHVLQQDYAAQLDPETEAPALAELRRRALATERRTLLHLLHTGQIGDDAFHRLEEALDWAEAEA